jgi:predicted alpha-1,2-mannosidase
MEKLVLHCRKWSACFLLLLIVYLSTNAAALAADCEPIDCVDPFVGTDAHGHTYPGATVPFGMVQLSPDTYDKGWDWCSGYHWSDSSIMGFSHTHLSGTGCGDLDDILFAATTGDIKLVPGTREQPESGYRSRFSHADEKAAPGSYSVLLKSYDIKAELTATKHCGFHSYTYPHTKKSCNIIVDLTHGIEFKPVDVQLAVVGDNKVEGMRHVSGWAKNRYIYFSAEFSKPFKTFGTSTDDSTSQAGSRHAAGANVKGWFTFDTTDGVPLLAKVGLSTTSVEAAAANLNAEIPEWDFALTKESAKQTWSENLARVDVDGGTEKEKHTFYTALYHAMLAPTVISDVDGKYRGSDSQVHHGKDF